MVEKRLCPARAILLARGMVSDLLNAVRRLNTPNASRRATGAKNSRLPNSAIKTHRPPAINRPPDTATPARVNLSAAVGGLPISKNFFASAANRRIRPRRFPKIIRTISLTAFSKSSHLRIFLITIRIMWEGRLSEVTIDATKNGYSTDKMPTT